MEPNDTAPDDGPGLLAGLLSPLRLPERVVSAIEDIAERLEDMRPMRENVDTIREQSSDLNDLLPALTSMKEDLGGRLHGLHACVLDLEDIEKGLDKRVGDLCKEMTTLRATVEGLKGDVERITERLPDPNAPGPLERARDLLTADD